ncbi:MAG: hypothetical protein IEMM0006_0036 [bacterium]|nr:MAG: hypothetical protein IEMM0006_0036 [bacterium]
MAMNKACFFNQQISSGIQKQEFYIPISFFN